ncbi:MAG: protein kinase [Byssovorax sp.]
MSLLDDAGMARLRALAAEPDVIADRFELGEPIGEGGMGTVYRAVDRSSGAAVALKIVRVPNDQAEARFEREAAALAELSHPGIVRYVAHGFTGAGERYLAMELLSGVTLAERLGGGALGVHDTLEVGRGLAAALAAAHALGLVHRDVKPGNVFLEAGSVSRVKVLDFGLARAPGGATVTRAGTLLGTPSYMAPEQVRGAKSIDARADVFALGALLFECLTGAPTFAGADTEAVLTKVLLEQPARLRELAPAIPPALEALLAAMLSKDPEGRPRDASVVARELAAIEATVTEPGSPLASDRSPLAPGTLIGGKYRVERALGRGGMGVVVLAYDETLGRRVAIKLLRAAGRGDEARFLREARAVARLTSEHVARILEVGALDDGAPFLVMEYASGSDLGRVLHDRGRLPAAIAVDYLLQAGEVLAEAHALGIIHRDLKPSNLFLAARVDGSPLIKVLDFGIAKSMPGVAGNAEETSLTATSATIGSPLYMSPEQLHSARDVDARTDLWSLGAVLHELLTGRPPFEAESAAAVGAKIAAAAPTPLAEGCPDAPGGLAAVVLRCLEKDPDRRFQDLAELAEALAPYATEASRISIDRIVRVVRAGLRTGDAVALPPAPTAAERATTTRGWVAPPASTMRRGALVAGAALLAIGAVVLALRPGPRATPTVAAAVPSSAAPAPTPAEVAAAMPSSSAPALGSSAVEKPSRAPVSSARAAAQAPSHAPRIKAPPPAAKAIDPLDPALMGR